MNKICACLIRLKILGNDCHERQGESRGFGALIAVLSITLGVSAVSFSVLGASVSFADSIDHHESQIQTQLYQKACDDSAALIKAKDIFAFGTVEFPEFGCSSTI